MRFLDPFGMIAASALPDAVKVSLILELSDASGSRGMVAGQVLDMEGAQTAHVSRVADHPCQ